MFPIRVYAIALKRKRQAEGINPNTNPTRLLSIDSNGNEERWAGDKRMQKTKPKATDHKQLLWCNNTIDIHI